MHFLQFLNKILKQDVPAYKLKTDIMNVNVEKCLRKISLCFSFLNSSDRGFTENLISHLLEKASPLKHVWHFLLRRR